MAHQPAGGPSPERRPDGTDHLHTVEIVALLRELTARLITSDDLDQALGALVRTTAHVVPERAWCAVTLVRAGGPSTAAVSAELPEGVDEVSPPVDDGPCLTAIRTRELTVSQDLATESRWPAWRRRVAPDAVRGALSVPVDIDEQVIGALTLYPNRPDRLSPDVQLATMLIAEHAGLLLAAVLDRGRQADLTAGLTAALSSGETVNRAVGIVMAQRGCSAEEALHVLQHAAARVSLPLHDVADRLVEMIASRSPNADPEQR